MLDFHLNFVYFDKYIWFLILHKIQTRLLRWVPKLWTDGSDSLQSEPKPKHGVDSEHIQVLLACSFYYIYACILH